MDEMRVNLTSKFMKGVITKLIGTLIRKKLGYSVDIQLNDVIIVSSNGRVHVHADLDAETTNEEFAKIVKSLTKDES